MYQKYFISIIIIFLFACSKPEAKFQESSKSQKEIFSTKIEAKQKILEVLSKRNPSESFVDIQSISHINTESEILAIVFYSSKTGSHNMLFRKTNTGDETEQLKITVCQGYDCNCKVNTTIDNQGNVSIVCSCAYCTMVTTD